MLDYRRVITMLAYTGLYYHSNSYSSLKEVFVICRFGWCPAKWTDMQDLVGINVSEVGWNNFNFTRYGWWQSEVLWAETQLITGDLVTGIRSVFAWDSSCIHLVRESTLLNTQWWLWNLLRRKLLKHETSTTSCTSRVIIHKCNGIHRISISTASIDFPLI